MRIIKPSWLSHSGEQKDFEVYSCHVSPDGKRLATAGGDGHVRVWSTEAILHSDRPGSGGKPRQLCCMSHHLGTIHSVRFSPNGRYLASGADDKIICVYQLEKGAPTSFGRSGPPPVENWKTYRRLVGHENDVQDLAWSYDSSLLVSVGLDSKIVVWSGHTFEKLKTLSGHSSHVKGITFDPANKYFATASDDRTIKVYRFTPPGPTATQHDMANNFGLETTITAPFKSSPLTTYFRRCSWSPDGNHIAAANAVNGPVSSVAIIERSRWDSETNLIGHEGPTEVCMFSPRLYHSTNPQEYGGMMNGGPGLLTVLASAGQDKTLTIWNTNTVRPVVIIQDLAGKSISDLSWTPDGQTVFASSLDGSIIGVRFGVGELGWVAQPEENDRALQKYQASRKGMGIAEDVEGLRLENWSKEGESRAAESRMGALMGDAQPQPTPRKATAATITLSTTPVAHSFSVDGAAGPTTMSPVIAAATNGNGSRRVEVADVETGITAAPATTSSRGTEAGKNGEERGVGVEGAEAKRSEEGDGESAERTAQRVKELKSRVTIGKDGKKRVAPLLVSSSGMGLSSLPQTKLVGSTTMTAAQNDAPHSILDLSRPFDGLPRGGIAALLIGNRRRAAVAAGTGDGGVDDDDNTAPIRRAMAAGPAVMIMNRTADGGVEPATVTRAAAPTGPPSYLRPALLNPSTSSAQVRLGVPKVRSHILRPMERGMVMQGDGQAGLDEAGRTSAENLVLEVRNPPLARDPSRVTVAKRGTVLWQDFLPRAVLLVTGSRLFWAAACEDGSVSVWSVAGRRLFGALVLESQPVLLECRDRWLLCVTAVGLCHVWDVKTQSSPHPPVSLGPVLELACTAAPGASSLVASPAPGVTSAGLTSAGCVVVTLTSGDGYFYARDMYVWQRVSEAWWAVGSQYWNSNDSSISALQSTAVGPRGPSEPAAAARHAAAAGPATAAATAVGITSKSTGKSTGTSAVAAAASATMSVSTGVLPFLERHTTAEFLLRGRAYALQRMIKALVARDGFDGFESTVSVAHLETRMAAALQLGAADEFRLYLYMYAKRLGAEGLRGKVEELLAWLVGGLLRDGSNSIGSGDRDDDDDDDNGDRDGRGWFGTGRIVCGVWDRRELLKGVVLILGKYRELQRLLVPHVRLLDLAAEDGPCGEGADAMQVDG